MIHAKQTVIFDHDGGIDDLLSLVLLLCMDHIELAGVMITPADCYPDDAVESTLKILAMFGKTNVPVVVGTIFGPNPFPADWRAQPRFVRALPAFLRTKADYNQVDQRPAHQWLAAVLEDSEEPLTILMTGPASNLARVTETNPRACHNIRRVIWMGGAIDVKGNVVMHDHNGTAEWNAYWHPQATHALLKAELPLLLVPLDATNQFPVSWSFLEDLAKINTPLAELAGQCWAVTVTSIPAYEFTYFMWDVLATCMLGVHSDALTIKSGFVNSSVSTPNAGNIWASDKDHGFACEWLVSSDAKQITNFIFDLLQTKKVAKLSFC